MEDTPRQQLGKLIATYGCSLMDEPRRCEGLLRDFCGAYRFEAQPKREWHRARLWFGAQRFPLGQTNPKLSHMYMRGGDRWS
jgi:hypothetical protein